MSDKSQTETQPQTTIKRLAVPIAEAAPICGMKVSAMRWAIFNGRGPKVVRHGRRMFFRIRDLETWLAENVEE